MNDSNLCVIRCTSSEILLFTTSPKLLSFSSDVLPYYPTALGVCVCTCHIHCMCDHYQLHEPAVCTLHTRCRPTQCIKQTSDNHPCTFVNGGVNA